MKKISSEKQMPPSSEKQMPPSIDKTDHSNVALSQQPVEKLHGMMAKYWSRSEKIWVLALKVLCHQTHLPLWV